MFLNETHNCKSFLMLAPPQKKIVNAYCKLSNLYISPIYSFYEQYHQG